MSAVVHLHATVSDRDYCDTECGRHCDEVDTAYRGLDPERVNCPECLKRCRLWVRRAGGAVMSTWVVTVALAKERAGYAPCDTPCEPRRSAYTDGIQGAGAYALALRKWDLFLAVMSS